MFFRKSQIEPLPTMMTAVKMGDRLLQMGLDEPRTAISLAGKVGLSGTAAHVVNDEAQGGRLRVAATKGGVLVDVRVVKTLRSLPYDDDAFDLVVMHSVKGLIAGMAPYTRVRSVEECLRVLRVGGRMLVIEAEPRGGLGSLIRPYPVDGHYVATGETVGALKAEGFRPVRILADREGLRFVEGHKPFPQPEG
jgi:SAM-dependent methyltransferase